MQDYTAARAARAMFQDRFLGLAALIEPIATRVVGSRRFETSGTGTIREGDTSPGVLLDTRDEYLCALLPSGGIKIARIVRSQHDGGWSACGFEFVVDSPFRFLVRGDRILKHLCEAMYGIPMREHAWRRQRVMRFERELYNALRQRTA